MLVVLIVMMLMMVDHDDDDNDDGDDDDDDKTPKTLPDDHILVILSPYSAQVSRRNSHMKDSKCRLCILLQQAMP